MRVHIVSGNFLKNGTRENSVTVLAGARNLEIPGNNVNPEWACRGGHACRGGRTGHPTPMQRSTELDMQRSTELDMQRWTDRTCRGGRTGHAEGDRHAEGKGGRTCRGEGGGRHAEVNGTGHAEGKGEGNWTCRGGRREACRGGRTSPSREACRGGEVGGEVVGASSLGDIHRQNTIRRRHLSGTNGAGVLLEGRRRHLSRTNFGHVRDGSLSGTKLAGLRLRTPGIVLVVGPRLRTPGIVLALVANLEHRA